MQLKRKTVVYCLGLFTILSAIAAAEVAARRAGRTDAERAQLLDPGPIGKSTDKKRDNFNYFNEQIIREDRPVGTVFLGDSITEAWNIDAYFDPQPGEVMQNRGISGDHSIYMVKRFAADVLQLRPRNLFILAGTNDINRRVKTKETDEQITRVIVDAHARMIDMAHKQKINVFICSILPTNTDFNMHEYRPGLRQKVNAKLKELCDAKGCIYLDCFTPMAAGGNVLGKQFAHDGIHPHYGGLKVMADTLKAAAKKKKIQL